MSVQFSFPLVPINLSSLAGKMQLLGVDIGCSSIKYGLIRLDGIIKVINFDTIEISLTDGEDKYFKSLSRIINDTVGYSAAGFGFPSRVWENKILRTTFNFDEIWSRIQDLLHAFNVPCYALNDADAAGIAEVHRNEAENLRKGVTILLTLGSGIGSAVFLDGKLIPNTEIGTLEMRGIPAEQYAAPSVISLESLSIQEWAARLQEFLMIVEHFLPPNHLILGGGISANFNEYASRLNTLATLQPAYFRNQAGVIGAAIYAAQQYHNYESK